MKFREKETPNQKFRAFFTSQSSIEKFRGSKARVMYMRIYMQYQQLLNEKFLRIFKSLLPILVTRIGASGGNYYLFEFGKIAKHFFDIYLK